MKPYYFVLLSISLVLFSCGNTSIKKESESSEKVHAYIYDLDSGFVIAEITGKVFNDTMSQMEYEVDEDSLGIYYEDVYFMNLSQPIYFYYKGDTSKHKQISTVQLGLIWDSILDPTELLGKTITVKGELGEAQTQHHYTNPVLFSGLIVKK
jgi:hypothetical protein